MEHANDVLIVVQQDDDAPLLLQAMSRFSHRPRCHVVRVIYEGVADLPSRHVNDAQELKSFVLQAEENQLQDIIADAGASVGEIESAVVWNARTWEGVLHAAEACKADLIVKRSAGSEGAMFPLRAPDDWNLLRHSSVPVLLSAGREWKATPDIVVAVDIYDEAHAGLNFRILEEAAALCEALGGRLHLVSVIPSLSVIMDTAPATTRMMREEIELEAIELLQEFLAASTVDDCEVTVLEGDAGERIAQYCVDNHADLLALGTKARSGLAGLMLGNASEQILAMADVDVLTVPPVDADS